MYKDSTKDRREKLEVHGCNDPTSFFKQRSIILRQIMTLWGRTESDTTEATQRQQKRDIVRASKVEPVVENLPANARDARDMGLIPGSGRPPGVGNGNPLQYSCLENSTDRGVWWATVHEITEELDMTQ